VPEDSARVHREMRVVNDVVGPCAGMTWRWGGWPLFHGHGGASVATDAIGYSKVSIRGYGLPS
jgi:hypothetical protein